MAKIQVQKQRFSITGKDDITLTFEVTPDHIHFLNEDLERDFVFMSTNDAETLKRWHEILKLMQMALKYVEFVNLNNHAENISKPLKKPRKRGGGVVF